MKKILRQAHYKQKGFTIIELIVVIAIIAILAAVVMVNVTQYINKSKDASIKANIDSIKTGAIIYFADEEKGNGSWNFVGDENMTFYDDNSYIVPATAIENINGSGEELVKFFESATQTFCVSSPLVSDNSMHWCVDSSGFADLGDCDSHLNEETLLVYSYCTAQ